MQLRYGNLFFQANGVAITRSFSLLMGNDMLPYAQRWRWTVEGEWIAVGQDLLARAGALIQAALARPFQDLVFLTDAGGVAMALTNANSISGVRIVEGGDGSTFGAEFATTRHFRFVAEADYATRTGFYLMDFEETVETWGGDPQVIWQPNLDDAPEKQIGYAQLPYEALQAGSAVGSDRYPPIPAELFPGFRTEKPHIRRTSPKREGFVDRRWGVSWSYKFMSARPLLGLPHVWL